MLNSMNNPLKVALMSISPHNRAILEFFFAGAGKKLFMPVAVDQAEALIIDFDHPGGRQEWQDQNAGIPKPAIVISVKETLEDHTVWVSKPLTSQALAGAVEQVRDLMPALAVAPAPASRNDEKTAADSDENIDSLRALLDKQAHDLRPFGVSKQQSIKAVPPVLAAPVPTRMEALLTTTEGKVAGQTTEVVGSANQTEQGQHFVRTEDVYIPPPLEDAEVEGTDSHFGIEDAQAIDPFVQEQRWNHLCGLEDAVMPENWRESTALYSPADHLLNSLIDGLELSHKFKQYVQLEIGTSENGVDNKAFMLLMPDVHLIYSSIPLMSDEFVELCCTPLESIAVNLHLPSSAELETLQETVQRDSEHTYDMESLIWTMSLLTSRGRLNQHAVNLSQPLRLKHWPNLTRLEHFPHVLQIAAAWQQRTGTVFDVSNWFDIPQRYVIAFYNAAHTLSLFTVEQAPSPQSEKKPAPRKNRGLFSRLLKRLIGGGAK